MLHSSDNKNVKNAYKWLWMYRLFVAGLHIVPSSSFEVYVVTLVQ